MKTTTLNGILFLIFLLGVSCDGKLTDEQRRRLNDGMKMNRIRKISEAQLTEAAFSYGRTIAAGAEKIIVSNWSSKDSLEKKYRVRISLLYAGHGKKSDLEKQLTEAYDDPSAAGSAPDNVQKSGKDSVLYTKPFYRAQNNGKPKFDYAIEVRASRKQIVNSIKD